MCRAAACSRSRLKCIAPWLARNAREGRPRIVHGFAHKVLRFLAQAPTRARNTVRARASITLPLVCP